MERKIVLRKWLALLLSGVVSLTGSAYADNGNVWINGDEEEEEQIQDSNHQSEASVIVTDDPKTY